MVQRSREKRFRHDRLDGCRIGVAIRVRNKVAIAVPGQRHSTGLPSLMLDLGGARMIARAGLRRFFLLLALVGLAGAAPAQTPLPRIASANGRHALMVDGAPFLMLGVAGQQLHQLSGDAASGLADGRTRSAPTPSRSRSPGSRSSRSRAASISPTSTPCCRQARAGTTSAWSCSGSPPGRTPAPSYAPEWVKTDTRRFPRMRTRDGGTHYALSPHGRDDARGRPARLRPADGTSARPRPAAHRDHGPGRERGRQLRQPARLLARGAAPVRRPGPGRAGQRPAPPPGHLGAGLRRRAPTSSFNAWHVARYVDEVAAAGKAVRTCRCTCNAALGDPFTEDGAENCRQRRAELERDRNLEGGGAAHRSGRARHLQSRPPRLSRRTSTIMAGPTTPLFVPETGNALEYRPLLLARARPRRDRLFAVRHRCDRLFQLSARREASSTPRRFEAFAAPYRLLGADRARLGPARLRDIRPGASPRPPTAPTSRRPWAAGG